MLGEDSKTKKLIERLIDKSIEAFIMGLEIYNKPTIHYRIEGFSFFICNAWELMLKAELLKRGIDIYYQDKQDRTFSLSRCIKEIWTNKNDPMRKNLERINHLRDISTHFITEDYERIYAPLFQACVLNYTAKMKEFHNVNMNDYIAQNFLTLGMRAKVATDDEIRATYPKELAAKLLSEKREIGAEEKELSPEYAIPIYMNFYITKDKKNADFIVANSPDSNIPVQYIKKITDPNKLYPYRLGQIVKLVNRKLKTDGVVIYKILDHQHKKGHFTMTDANLFNEFYDIKSSKKYCFYHESLNQYTYSFQYEEFIVEELEKDPTGCLPNIKKELKQQKR